MERIEINKIIIKKRKRTDGDIDRLIESIESIGLINPITISKDNVLIAGYHRLEACKKLGWNEIPIIVLDVDELISELAEIDENFVRNPLTDLERAEQFKRRKEIYEILHPESKRIEKVKSNLKQFTDNEIISPSKQKTFTQDTAEKTGKSQRSIQQDIQIASNISEEVKQEIKGSKIENSKVDLIELAKVKAPEKQKELVKKVKTGQAKNIKTALQESPLEQESKEKTHVSADEYEKIKKALQASENECNILKKENQELKAKIKELEKQINTNKEEIIKNDIIQDEKIDDIHRKVLVDKEWLELPPAYQMQGKTYEQMYWVAKNYSKTKQKELANASSKINS